MIGHYNMSEAARPTRLANRGSDEGPDDQRARIEFWAPPCGRRMALNSFISTSLINTGSQTVIRNSSTFIIHPTLAEAFQSAVADVK